MSSQVDSLALLSQIQRKSLAVGLVMSVVSAWCAFAVPGQFYPAYLVAFLFFWSISMGCFALSCLHHITGGGWGVAIRRTLETGASKLPLLALLFVPVLFGLPRLYLWARPSAVASDVILQHKSAYLNVGFFQVRAGIYFAAWILFASTINRMSAKCDLEPSIERRESLAYMSSVGLIVWALTTTFASIDWTMSLDPHWVSGIHGVITMAGQSVAGTAFVILTITLLSGYAPIARVLNASRLHDLGNFLMALVLFWAYTSFTQYLVIWSGNLPEETPWYLIRGRGGWQIVMLLLVGLHFIVPFLLLLNRSVKRKPRQLAAVALLLLAMRIVDLYWQVMPTFSPGGFQFNWVVLCTIPAVGGLWLAGFARRLPAFASVIVDDPHSEESHHHAHA
ncbi:MAG: hypothetical protein JWN70_5221 [Planctomycetaceae bacterium]|nr:hypothetical protein [Planctomycetaceae bacterium]